MAAPTGLSGAGPEPAAGQAPGAAPTVPQQAGAPAEDLTASEVPAGELAAPDGRAVELAAPDGRAVELAAPDARAEEETAGDGWEPAAEAAGAGEAGPAGDAGLSGGRRRRRVLGVVASVFGVLVLAGAAVVVLAVVTHGFKPKTVVTYRPAAVFRLRAGDCINSSPNGLAVTVLSCATPHDAEVFATFRLTGTSWPGSAAAQQAASSGCASRVSGYLNPQLLTAGLSQQFVFPDQKAWQAGIRTVVCEVSSSSGPLTGSVRQGG